MFTGIIETIGIVRSETSSSLWLDVSFASELKIGQSVACNGVCLTVVEYDSKGFKVELLEETKQKSSFAGLEKGSHVNVERAMKIGDRFDGHIVMAHSEGVGAIVKILPEQENPKSKASNPKQISMSKIRNSKHIQSLNFELRTTWLITLKVPKHLMKYMLLKGIVILDGIALTLTKVDQKKSQIEVAIIPHTWENTNLSVLKVGDPVNVETDVLGKWMEKFTS